MTRFLILLLSCLIGLSSLAQAAYLNLQSIQLSDFPAPPAPGSPEDKKDFQILHHWQQIRTKAQCAKAESQVTASFESFFGDILNPQEIKKLQSLYDHVSQDTDLFVEELKAEWHRPRPYLRDNTIVLCIDSHPATSYPSGHAAISRAMADVLGLIYPARAQRFLQAAHQAAQNRVLGGVHHPSDVNAGKLLGDLVFEALEKNPEFISDVQKLK